MGVTFIAPQGTYTAPAKLVTKEITENGTYDATDDSANGYSSVTVNVEGGGGSSDFSTAEVTVVSTNGRLIGAGYLFKEEGFDDVLMYGITEAGTYDVFLYKGNAVLMADAGPGETITVSGNAQVDGHEIYITGDCTITIS